MSRLRRVFVRLMLGRPLQRETDRNRAAAKVLDATLKEMLGR